MKKVAHAANYRTLYAGLLWLGLSVAQAACDQPTLAADIPDGKSASQEVMLAAQQAVNDFVGAGEEYIKCVERSEPRGVAERMRNDMLDQMEQLAAQFNRQLRYFRRNNS